MVLPLTPYEWLILLVIISFTTYSVNPFMKPPIPLYRMSWAEYVERKREKGGFFGFTLSRWIFPFTDYAWLQTIFSTFVYGSMVVGVFLYFQSYEGLAAADAYFNSVLGIYVCQCFLYKYYWVYWEAVTEDDIDDQANRSHSMAATALIFLYGLTSIGLWITGAIDIQLNAAGNNASPLVATQAFITVYSFFAFVGTWAAHGYKKQAVKLYNKTMRKHGMNEADVALSSANAAETPTQYAFKSM